MARLTRTQKYAELRDSLANDKESSLQTKDLSNYEDRLNNITGTPSPVFQKEENAPVYRPEFPDDNDPKYTWKDFEETPVEQLVESFKNDEVQPQIDSFRNETEAWKPVFEQPAPVEERPVVTAAPVEEVSIASAAQTTKPQEETYQYNAPAYEPPVQPAPVYPDPAPWFNEAVQQPAPEPVVQPVVQSEPEPARPEPSEAPWMDEPLTSPIGKAEPAPAYLDPNAVLSTEEVEVPKPQQDVFVNPAPAVAPVTEDIPEEGDHHAANPFDDQINSYINDMINEVGEYNKMNGDMTISQIASSMVNEIRHPDEVKPQSEPVAPVASAPEDEEFSNTVTTEITKIMDEISQNADRDEDVLIEPLDVQIETPSGEAAPVQPVAEEHPVMAIAQEEEAEDVVEIKNLKELEAEAVKDTVSNTIPFVVATEEDEEEIEDDDEEGSNTILNIILIILIIILIAVLGLIVFYILKTKGII